eukprot:TRINITY_DN169_c0_g1_i2.p1 TRINITY_DN169_c0_g1~~TRINITY_DN169_c0_g1_i2.p1  ORF type:complete len:495 (-),score=133.89 TRINITY_DN169_c0_g1_i2:27-1511(-)
MSDEAMPQATEVDPATTVQDEATVMPTDVDEEASAAERLFEDFDASAVEEDSAPRPTELDETEDQETSAAERLFADFDADLAAPKAKEAAEPEEDLEDADRQERLLKFFEDEADEAEEADSDEDVRVEIEEVEEPSASAAATASTPQKKVPRSSPSKMNPGKENIQPSPSPSPRLSPTSPNKTSPSKGDQFVDESRFLRDENGALVYKWKADYAARAGGGRAMCRDQDCLERHEQAGVRTIEKGELRIGRRVLMDKDGKGEGGQMHIMWYHARCIFNTFLRSRKATRVIESPEDIEGFSELRTEDQELLRNIIAGNEDLRKARFRTNDGATTTPAKRGVGADAYTPAAKRAKEQKLILTKGARCWTYCRVRPKIPERPGEIVDIAVRSAKPELGQVVEEEKDGSFIIQFESTEHEKERVERMQMRRYRRITGWLRYPRVFEGKKQRIPATWIQWNRKPPALCSCKKQEWGHTCVNSGISCTRGARSSVWGIGDD